MSTDQKLIDDMPTACHKCDGSLCLRKQVINLALGNTDNMSCLNCLAKEMNVEPADVLLRLKEYVAGRECFQKQWIRYENVSDCPDQQNCFPGVCF